MESSYVSQYCPLRSYLPEARRTTCLSDTISPLWCPDAICGHVTTSKLWCIFHAKEKMKNSELILSQFPQKSSTENWMWAFWQSVWKILAISLKKKLCQRFEFSGVDSMWEPRLASGHWSPGGHNGAQKHMIDNTSCLWILQWTKLCNEVDWGEPNWENVNWVLLRCDECAPLLSSMWNEMFNLHSHEMTHQWVSKVNSWWTNMNCSELSATSNCKFPHHAALSIFCFHELTGASRTNDVCTTLPTFTWRKWHPCLAANRNLRQQLPLVTSVMGGMINGDNVQVKKRITGIPQKFSCEIFVKLLGPNNATAYHSAEMH